MKKILITIFALISFEAYSQNTTDSTGLYQKTKVELTDIYLSEVNRVVNKIPLITFDSVGGNVPESKYNQKKFKSVHDVEKKYNEKIVESYNVIIPYADKSKIIEAIIYLQSIK